MISRVRFIIDQSNNARFNREILHVEDVKWFGFKGTGGPKWDIAESGVIIIIEMSIWLLFYINRIDSFEHVINLFELLLILPIGTGL